MSGGRRRERRGRMGLNFEVKFLKRPKFPNAHKTFIYSLTVTQNWREIGISNQISLEFEFEFVEPKFY